jgi:uncharacterized membrane protein YgaE (UPF0421/DUF939 family)
MASYAVKWSGWPVLAHSVRTAVTAVVSLLVAQWLRLPSTYWAPITTLVIAQSSLGAAFAVSSQRFVGTVLGAVVGAVLAQYFGSNLPVYGAGLFVLGLLCALARSGPSAYRFGGVALSIVVLIPRSNSAWLVAFHRFTEVSVGIAVALLLALVWPEKDPTLPK